MDRKIVISYGRTLNLGNFNSERIEFTKEFDADTPPQEAFAECRREVSVMAETAKTERAKAMQEMLKGAK